VFINPLGFALESFDAVGQFQSVDKGQAIDTTATVIVYPDTLEVTGAVELMHALADSPQSNLCYAQKWIQHAFAAGTGERSCLAEKLALVLERSSITDMLLETTQSEWFLGTTAGTAPLPDPTTNPSDRDPAVPAPEPRPGSGGSIAEPNPGTSGTTATPDPVNTADAGTSDNGGRTEPSVDDAGSRPDSSEGAATRAPPDSGNDDARDSRRRGVAPAPDGAGCGCRTTSNGAVTGWWLLLGLLILRRWVELAPRQPR
jgi:MYXO-CTERM domain-containing protein